MVEPITIGGLVALALSTATEAAVKGVVEEATKNAYNTLKEKLSRFGSCEVDALEKSPGSVDQQLIIANLVDAQPKDEKESLRVLALRLVTTLKPSISTDNLAISREWKAELLNKTVKSFTIVFWLFEEYHRLEYQIAVPSGALELDGTEIERYSTVGKKLKTFRYFCTKTRFIVFRSDLILIIMPT